MAERPFPHRIGVSQKVGYGFFALCDDCAWRSGYFGQRLDADVVALAHQGVTLRVTERRRRSGAVPETDEMFERRPRA